MITRACISGMIALITAVLGFGEFFVGSANYVQTISFIFLAFCGLSLLLSLFEADPMVTTQEGDLKTVREELA